MSLQKTIKTARKQAGYSQITFAQALKVSQSTIHHWESGHRTPSPAQYQAIARLLQLPDTPGLAFPATQPDSRDCSPLSLAPELHHIQRVAFQGTRGAYSHQAIIACFPEASAEPHESFDQAMHAVIDRSNPCELAMIPIENSLYGRVSDIHHLLPESPLSIVGEYYMPIHHMLVGTHDASLEGITKAISHHQALGQTRKTLASLGIERQNWSDTAAAAAEVARRNDPTLAAVASEAAASEYKLQILRRRIEDRLDNVTRFIIMSPRRIDPHPDQDNVITSMFFTARSIPAALYKCLGGFATEGINIRKLESYVPFETSSRASFYCEIEGNPGNRRVHNALAELEYYTTRARIIGVFAAENKPSGAL